MNTKGGAEVHPIVKNTSRRLFRAKNSKSVFRDSDSEDERKQARLERLQKWKDKQVYLKAFEILEQESF